MAVERRAADTAVVAAIAARPEEALRSVVLEHGPYVIGSARGPLGHGDLAEDIAQEIFLQLWLSPERFDAERGSLRSWLVGQGRLRAVDRWRSESSRQRRERRSAPAQAPAAPVDEEVMARLTAARLREAVARLDPRERDPIELAFFGDHSYREVARLLCQPESTVKRRIRTGLCRLRAALE